MSAAGPVDPVDVVNGLGAVWSPTLDAHIASGGAVPLVCVLCHISPCSCPPFGSDEYLAMFARRHDRPLDFTTSELEAIAERLTQLNEAGEQQPEG